ncbi:hypothetical protein V6N13_121918 [Hibiscus sabdariffa]
MVDVPEWLSGMTRNHVGSARAVNAVAAGATSYIHPAVLDHCKRPGGPHPGCHPNPKGPLKQANPYNRGCSRHHRCRS